MFQWNASLDPACEKNNSCAGWIVSGGILCAVCRVLCVLCAACCVCCVPRAVCAVCRVLCVLRAVAPSVCCDCDVTVL